MTLPQELYYTKSHEWILIEDNTATIGITDFIAEYLILPLLNY